MIEKIIEVAAQNLVAPVAPTQLERASCHDDACDSGGMFDYSEAIERLQKCN